MTTTKEKSINQDKATAIPILCGERHLDGSICNREYNHPGEHCEQKKSDYTHEYQNRWWPKDGGSTPWHFDTNNEREIIINDSLGNMVHYENFTEFPSEMSGEQMHEIIFRGKKSAALIVRAVNEHAALIALEESAEAMAEEPTENNRFFLKKALANLAAIRSTNLASS